MSIESSADWDGLRAVSAVVRQTLALLGETLVITHGEPIVLTGTA